MAPLHQAAKDGQLDECRRLVEKECKDVNEKDEVSVCLFDHQSQIGIGEHFKIILASSFNAFDHEHQVNNIYFPEHQHQHQHQYQHTTQTPNPSSAFSCLSCTNFVFCCRLVTRLSTVHHPMDIWKLCNI
jgi:hypothetical protein